MRLSGFSQTHKVDNIGIIANFVFRYICSFLHYLHHVEIDVKLDASEYKRIIFHDCRPHWSCSFLMTQQKLS